MKNTHFSRLMAALLAAVLLLSCACVALADEPIEMTAFAITNSKVPLNDRALTKIIEERLGIRIDTTQYSSDAGDTQLSLLMADDNLPDLLTEMSLSRADVNRYGQEGFFLDLSQYLDIMPNFKARLEADPALNAYSRDENGAIYGISKTRDSLCSRAVAMAYLDNNWLKKVGMEYPKTTEDLYQVLKAFKEQDANGNGDPNDEIPLSFTYDQYSGTRTEFVLRSAFGIYGYASNLQLQVGKDGKVYLAESTNNWKEYVKYMNRLYAEELLDRNAFIQTNDEYLEKFVGGRVGLFGSWNTLDRSFIDQGKNAYLNYSFFTGVASDLVDEVIYPLWNPVTSTCVMMVSADCKYPEAACKLIDFFYSDEGMVMSINGAEGVNHNVVEGYKGIKAYDFDGYWQNSPAGSAADYRSNYVVYGNAFQFVQYDPAQRWVDNATDEELEIALKEDESQVTLIDAFKENARRKVTCIDDYPNLAYTGAESSERAALVADIQNYIKTMKAQFIIGALDIDAEWDNFVNTLNGMGLERLLALEQGAYNRYIAN